MLTSDIFQTMAGGAPSREPYEDTRERIQELHVFSWNVTGMRTVDFDTWLQHIGEAHPWDIILIQEGFSFLGRPGRWGTLSFRPVLSTFTAAF